MEEERGCQLLYYSTSYEGGKTRKLKTLLPYTNILIIDGFKPPYVIAFVVRNFAIIQMILIFFGRQLR